MKKLLLILLCLPLLFSSCTSTFNTTLLEPLESSISPKLPIQLSSYYLKVSPDNGRSKRIKGNIKELLEDELIENIITHSKTSKGYLVPNIRIAALNNGIVGFLNGLTVFMGPLIGIPSSGVNISIASKFEIKDANNKVIWKKNYVDQITVLHGLYWKNNTYNKTLKLFRERLAVLKEDIEKDISSITEKLDECKKIIPLDKNKVPNDNWKGNGSGFFISESGYIVTNHHVIDGASEIEVVFKYNNEIKTFNAKVIQTDEINDLAIIKIDDGKFSNLSSLPYNFKTRTVDVGTEVFALGYPMALTIMGKEIKYTPGSISSKTGYKGNITTYQSTTPLQPGNSGGPLFDFKGNLIGVNSAIIKTDVAENVSYSIKTSYLSNLIDVLPETISLPSSTQLASKPLTEQIKVLSDYVVLIKVK